MAFCSVCGVKLEDNASFCSYCGSGVSTQVVYVQKPSKPKAPGRGMGAASMIVGIVAALYSAAVMAPTISYLVGSFVGDPDEFKTTTMAFAMFAMVLSTLTLIFQAVANSKGYKRKSRLAGLILGVSSIALCSISMLLLLTA